MVKLGLDLGSSSCGWAIRKGDKIIKDGVITFNTGMSKGQSGGYTSPTRERREARSKRRLIQARKYRKWELLKILCKNQEFVPLKEQELKNWREYRKGKTRKFPESEQFLKWLACDFTYEGGKKYKNPYEIRVALLDNKLSKHEFGRALYHLVQRRGYKDIGESNKETEKQIERRGESGFKDALANNRTIAEALKNEFLAKGKRARNEYPYREEYQNELEEICKAQGYDITKEGKEDYKDEFVRSLWKAIIWQRSLRPQKGLIGKCTLEPTANRCPVSHPIFEVFRAWQFINTIKYLDDNGKKQPLSSEIRKALFKEKFLKAGKNFKFENIKGFLHKQLQKKVEFNYPISKKTGKYETSISGMPICRGLIDMFGIRAENALEKIEKYTIQDAPKIIDRYSIYDLWHALFSFDEKYLQETLSRNKFDFEDEMINQKDRQIPISPLVLLKRKMTTGYGDLSLKAMRKIIPFLKAGYLYNEAVVLAKVPELLGEGWSVKKDAIIEVLKSSNKTYEWNKRVVSIANKLIETHKGLEYPENFAHESFDYLLQESDNTKIVNGCKNAFGEESWNDFEEKSALINQVGQEYQNYFFDTKRRFRKLPTLADIFEEKLTDSGVNFEGELYHHSNRKNLYEQNLDINFETGERYLPLHKPTRKAILPIPRIDSIKNPMFNKAMSVLRKLINELIVNGEIDEDTEVTVELARELNDNNKRAAIEKYQNERKQLRQKIREILEEYKRQEKSSINIEESIPLVESWSEQVFLETEDENGKKIINQDINEVLNIKKATERYQLWLEQKGQCMYTGKMISMTQLFSNEIDIEHTIPRSLLPDNTRANKTVAFAKYNRNDKGKDLPYYLPNFSKDIEGKGTAILPRLDNWKKIRDDWEEKYEKNKKPKGNEDEILKNKRVKFKHYYKMHFDYWKDKVERFEAQEIKDSWARRQLVDTQMVSKYAREFLKLYFKKVAVQKGIVTASFRKIYGFQEADEIKSRNKHTHHAIDAAVLTLIPVNASKRDEILRKYYYAEENYSKHEIEKPYASFDSQKLIKHIESNTLIFNYEKDNIIKQTKKLVRKRGKIQYVKNKKGEFVLDKDGNKIIQKAHGDSVRSSLYKQTFLGKIKDVERYDNGQPKREGKDWKYKTGKDEFIYTERKKLKDVLSKTDDIIDPTIRETVREQKENAVDPQGNPIRHVRIKVKAGRVVKERLNYRSKHDYKNFYYSAADSLPYAIMLQKGGQNPERKMIPVASFEIAKIFKACRKFDLDYYLQEFYPDIGEWENKQLLKVGQKVLVLNDDSEYEKRKDKDFQKKRLYGITQFESSGKRIMLQHHLEAQSLPEVRAGVKEKQHKIVSKIEDELQLPEIVEDANIVDTLNRKKDFEKRKYDFNSRLKLIDSSTNSATKNKLEEKIKEYQTEYSSIPKAIVPSFLKMSKGSWKNFLYEGKGYDFEMNFLGEVKWNE